MNNVTKFLLLAFSIMLTCLLIVYFKRVADTGLHTSNTAMEKLNDFNRSLSESSITMYEGMEVNGSDVVNFIKKNLGDYRASDESPMYVRVITGMNDTTHINGISLLEIQNFTSPLYIKPTARFRCGITRDDNDVIIGICFEQI